MSDPVSSAAVPDVTALALEKLRLIAEDRPVMTVVGRTGRRIPRFSAAEAAALLALAERTRQERDEAIDAVGVWLERALRAERERDEAHETFKAQLRAGTEDVRRERDAAVARERELREAIPIVEA